MGGGASMSPTESNAFMSMYKICCGGATATECKNSKITSKLQLVFKYTIENF